MSLYNLRSADGSYRIQKFDEELNPLFDSSYIISENFKECSCPAGHRQTCRHRQMLGPMLAAGLLDSPDFWNHDLGRVEPGQVAFIDEAATIEAEVWNEFRPHSTTVSAADFDSADGGSNPPVAATPFKRRF